MDLLGFGPGGFPSQLAPTMNRNGREHCSERVLAVVKARKAGGIARRWGYCFALVAHVLCPYLRRVNGRDIGWGLRGRKVRNTVARVKR